jgi:non-homologous end joining protein Ku
MMEYGAVIETTINLRPSQEALLEDLHYRWKTKVRAMMATAAPATVRAAEVARAELVDQVVEVRAMRATARAYADAAGRALVVVRRRLPDGVVARIAAMI